MTNTEREQSSENHPMEHDYSRTGMKLNSESTECPNCHANLIGAEIPEKSRELFGNHSHFSRVIGIERDNDRIEAEGE
jgi:hypothetical protein